MTTPPGGDGPLRLGVNHNHIYGMANVLLEAGGELAELVVV